MKTRILLAEGSVEQAFYTKLLEKLAHMRNSASYPPKLRELLRPLRKTPPILTNRECTMVIINCGGYENTERALRELLRDDRTEELEAAIAEGLHNITIAADLDKDPRQRIPGILASLGHQPEQHDDTLRIRIENHALDITIIPQGTPGRPGATNQIEDHLEQLAAHLHPDIARAIAQLEQALGRPLNTKQRAEIYAAILVPHQGLPKLAATLIDEADPHTLRQHLHPIISRLLPAETRNA